MDFTSPIMLDENTELKPVFDPAFRCFSAQLWKNGEPAGLCGMVHEFTHPDDLMEAVDSFLVERGANPLTEEQMAHFGGALIMAKGGPDAMLLQMALEDPSKFILLD